MGNLPKALIALSVLAFVLAIFTHFTGALVGTQAEAYSRASANLALLAIAIELTLGRPQGTGRPL
jgi:hypothetical protein